MPQEGHGWQVERLTSHSLCRQVEVPALPDEFQRIGAGMDRVAASIRSYGRRSAAPGINSGAGAGAATVPLPTAARPVMAKVLSRSSDYSGKPKGLFALFRLIRGSRRRHFRSVIQTTPARSPS